MRFSGKMSHENIKSRKKSELHPLSEKYVFGKTTGESI